VAVLLLLTVWSLIVEKSQFERTYTSLVLGHDELNVKVCLS
jgi:hypothetical protein